MTQADRRTAALAEALSVLGVRRLAFGIHESAFPPGPADLGHGSRASAGGTRVLELARALGFNAVQLGPGGQITDANPSPYDGSAFARNVRSLDFSACCGEEDFHLLSPDTLAETLEREGPAPRRAAAARAGRIGRGLLPHAWRRLAGLRRAQPDHPLPASLSRFRARSRAWLEQDALYEALAEQSGHGESICFDPAVRSLFGSSPGAAAERRALRASLAEPIERAELAQFLLWKQAVAFRERGHARGLAVIGDLQVGWSPRDRLLRAEAFASGWLLGAPPSRTNPCGQPWGYPLLDPEQLDTPGSPARRLLALRVQHELEDHDGLRIDHPHGLVCPWIYRAGSLDPQRAVQRGTRAFASPDLDDAELARWAIARVADLDPSLPRSADGFVRTLDADQVARYSRLFDVVVEAAAEQGRGTDDIAAEVLSTCPTPLRRVLERHGLGRFRVTQKADPHDPGDVYRTDRAKPPDWLMLGNHDTDPILLVAERWLADGSAGARAAYLARRLVADESQRERAVARFCSSPGALAQAHFADLFLGDARNVLVSFTDLFGEREPFNRAGVIHPDNWTLRLDAEFEAVHARRTAEGVALDLPAALATALAARRLRPDLVATLEGR